MRCATSSEVQLPISVLLAEEVAVAQSRLHFAVGASNDVSSNETVANALACIGTGTHSSVHSTGFAAHQNSDVTVLVRGETGAVNAAVRAGADACERVGDGLVAAHIIARPHREVEPALGNGNFLGQKD